MPLPSGSLGPAPWGLSPLASSPCGFATAVSCPSAALPRSSGTPSPTRGPQACPWTLPSGNVAWTFPEGVKGNSVSGREHPPQGARSCHVTRVGLTVRVPSLWSPHSLTPRTASFPASKSMSVVFQPVRESPRIWTKRLPFLLRPISAGVRQRLGSPMSTFVVLWWAVHREGQSRARQRPCLGRVKRELAREPGGHTQQLWQSTVSLGTPWTSVSGFPNPLLSESRVEKPGRKWASVYPGR